MTTTETLQKTILFKGCTQDELDLVAGLFQERQLKANTTVFTEKMPAEALYVIKSGSVRITMMVEEGQEAGLIVLGPGDFFGELALLQESTRLVSVRTDTAAEILLLTRKDFQGLMDLDPKIALKLTTAITRLLAMRVKAYGNKLRDLLLT